MPTEPSFSGVKTSFCLLKELYILSEVSMCTSILIRACHLKVGKDRNNWDNLNNPLFFIWTVNRSQEIEQALCLFGNLL